VIIVSSAEQKKAARAKAKAEREAAKKAASGEKAGKKAIEFAKATLIRGMENAVLNEVRNMPDTWPKMSELTQKAFIHRLDQRMQEIVSKAIVILAADARPALKGTLLNISVKDGYKAAVQVSRTDPSRHLLADAIGSTVLVVIADAAPYSEGPLPKADPDQPKLPGVEGDGAGSNEKAGG
jgi:hypothetical protein